MVMVPAHKQAVTNRYYVNYPDHEPRQEDPNYVDFEAYRRAHIKTAKCAMAYTGECEGGLELHHSHIEFALQNGINLSWLEHDYPGVSDPKTVGAWVESGANLLFYCEHHHRGPGGVHKASSSDFEAEHYCHNLIGPATTEEK